MKKLVAVFAVLLLTTAVSSQAGSLSSGPGSPEVTFSGSTVSVSGLTRGAEVAVFGVAKEPLGYISRVVRWSGIVADTARSGSVTYDAGRTITPKSIWCVADLTTGKYTVASPNIEALRIMTVPSRPFRRSEKNVVDEFALDHANLDLLYVHPGHGAWVGVENDGSPTDRDGPNGVSVISLDHMRALGGGTSKSTEFVPGGVLVAVDVVRLEVLAIQIDGSMIAGAR